MKIIRKRDGSLVIHLSVEERKTAEEILNALKSKP